MAQERNDRGTAQQKHETNQANQPRQGQQSGQALEQQHGLERSNERRFDRLQQGSPLAFTRRFLDDVDQLFGEFFGMGGLSPWSESDLRAGHEALWTPKIEVLQRDSNLVVRADIPGVKKDDVHVELNEDSLTIEGRREQHNEERRGAVYHSERSYGSFRRTIPLPEGVIGESANATFRDGVLEIVMQAPPAHQQSRGRRLEIKGGENEQPGDANRK